MVALDCKSDTRSAQYHGWTQPEQKRSSTSLTKAAFIKELDCSSLLPCTGAALIVTSRSTSLISVQLLQRLTSCADECREMLGEHGVL